MAAANIALSKGLHNVMDMTRPFRASNTCSSP